MSGTLTFLQLISIVTQVAITLSESHLVGRPDAPIDLWRHPEDTRGDLLLRARRSPEEEEGESMADKAQMGAAAMKMGAEMAKERFKTEADDWRDVATGQKSAGEVVAGRVDEANTVGKAASDVMASKAKDFMVPSSNSGD